MANPLNTLLAAGLIQSELNSAYEEELEDAKRKLKRAEEEANSLRNKVQSGSGQLTPGAGWISKEDFKKNREYNCLGEIVPFLDDEEVDRRYKKMIENHNDPKNAFSDFAF